MLKPWTIRRASSLLIACGLVTICVGCGSNKQLARSLASEEGLDREARCNEQESGWFDCATSSDPTSGWPNRYVVILNSDDCWTGFVPAVRSGTPVISPDGSKVAAARRLEGCLHSADEDGVASAVALEGAPYRSLVLAAEAVLAGAEVVPAGDPSLGS